MKKQGIILLIALTMLFSGCAVTRDTHPTGDMQPSENSQLTENTQTTQAPEPTQSESSEDSEEPENTTPPEFVKAENEMLDLDKYSLTNASDEGHQVSYPFNYLTKGDAGYFYAVRECLHFMDPESEMTGTVCNKPNCRHKDDSCAANVFYTESSKALTLARIIYYKGYVYFVGCDYKEGYVNLYRIAEDGSTREEYMHLFRLDTSASSFRYPHFAIYQNAVYYVDNEEAEPCIRKCELGGEEQTIVFETNHPDGGISNMRFYGDYLFFEAGTRAKKESEFGVYAYNMRTGETKMVKKYVQGAYRVIEDKLYYVSDGDFYSYNLRTAEDVRVIDSDCSCNFLYNSKYVVLDNMEVYSLDGKYICKLAIDDFWNILGMDEDYIIAREFGEGDTEKLLLKPTSELNDKPFEEYTWED